MGSRIRYGYVLLALLFGGCAVFPDGRERSRFTSEESHREARLSEQTVALNASSAALSVDHAMVLTDNDDAFASKLRLIESAHESLDLAYYIFADDYSSSRLTKALIEAAQRGVRVRLLLDYHSNYTRLDWFSMMQQRGGVGKGSLEVRFFNRPSKNIVKDAVFLTMGCGEVQQPETGQCDTAKFAEIESRFALEATVDQSVAGRNISNLNIGGSGLFLSGLYAKNPQLMALAISEGQGLDPQQLQGDSTADQGDLARLKTLGRIYFDARYGGGLGRAVAQIKLSAIGLLYAEEVDPVYAAFTGYLPVERGQSTADARRDWRYLTEYLHHKFLLADASALLLGGRNVEDSYHMRPNPLTRKYVFRDTDMLVRLKTADTTLTASFDRLWDFDLMVVNLADVRRHAPNDFVVATKAAAAACETAPQRDDNAAARCRDTALAKARQRKLSQRLAGERRRMLANASTFLTRYRPAAAKDRSPQFAVDPSAVLHYIENLPLQRRPDSTSNQRGYGADNGREGDSGKHIHALWLSALREVCTLAEMDRPQRVIMHNAYFFPPSNLWERAARMIDGSEDCGDVTITVLTNSIETTDLNVVNIAARHSIKAFADFAKQSRHPQRGARFEYYEYLPPADAGGSQLSLHSKVLLIGPHLFIGSANADVRSYMMDTNNGLLIRNAPTLVSTYGDWVQSLLDDPSLTRDKTTYFQSTPRPQMLQEDKQTLRSILAKYRAERWIKDVNQQQSLENALENILDKIYSDTRSGLGDDGKGRKAQERFNETFKTI